MRPAPSRRSFASFAHFARAGLTAALLAATGCAYGYTTAMPLGRGAPPRPPDCSVRHANLLPQDAQRIYEQVGLLCYLYPGAPAYMPQQNVLEEETRSHVCRLGGQIVVRHGYCPGRNGPGGLELGVYVERSPGPGVAAPAVGAPPPTPSTAGRPAVGAPPPTPSTAARPE